jgi:hypothetical protein
MSELYCVLIGLFLFGCNLFTLHLVNWYRKSWQEAMTLVALQERLLLEMGVIVESTAGGIVVKRPKYQQNLLKH